MGNNGPHRKVSSVQQARINAEDRRKAPRVKHTKSEPFPIWYIRSNGIIRIGRSDWPGDAFEVMSESGFEDFRCVLEQLNLDHLLEQRD